MRHLKLPLDCLPSKFQWANLIRYYRRKAFETRRDADDLSLARYEEFLTYSAEHLETMLENAGLSTLVSLGDALDKIEEYTHVLLVTNRQHSIFDHSGEKVYYNRQPLDTRSHHLSHGTVTITPEALI
jgi:hypothetical protein